MKRLSEQNYYEVLEVSYRATWGEVQKAYELAKKTYGPGSIAAYSLFPTEDRDAIFQKIEEAYQTLSDQEKRRKYDEALAKVVQAFAQQAPSVEQPEPPVEEEIPVEGEIDGKTLKRIREKRGVSLQEIADKTRISITYLYFIEQDNYRSLPADVYLRNYLSQYAKLLHWDVPLIVDGYMKVYDRWRKDKPDQEPA